MSWCWLLACRHGASVWVSVQMRVCDQLVVHSQLLRSLVLEHSLTVAQVVEGGHRITEPCGPLGWMAHPWDRVNLTTHRGQPRPEWWEMPVLQPPGH